MTVSACTYRETVTITKPLTLVARGAMVDGGDIRTHAFIVTANDVVIDGFEVTRTTNPAQDGAIRVRSSQRFTLLNSRIHHAGGACVSIKGGSGHRIIRNEFAYCAQQGFHLSDVVDTVVVGNAIHHNNPRRDYDPAWEAGGGKAANARGLVFEQNRSWSNTGPGLWCDIGCRDVVFRSNEVWDNTGPGIFYEISSRGQILSNRLAGNGTDRPKSWWPWGANILVSSSGTTEVVGNTVCYGSAGITVVSQLRPRNPVDAATGIVVRQNDVAAASGRYGLSWAQDWSGPLFDVSSGNRGQNNRYWWKDKEDGQGRFGWNGQISTLTQFNKSPGEDAGVYLSSNPC